MWFDVLSVHACLVRSVLRVLLHIHDCIQCMQQITTMTTESAESESSTQPIVVSLISSEEEDNIQSRIARRTTQKLVTLTASSKQKVSKTTKRKKKTNKGHGWSKPGSKKSRRLARETTKTPHYYVVVRGWKPGVFTVRKNAKTQLQGYNDGLMETFTDMVKARAFFKEHMTTPPGLFQPFPPAPDTPDPPVEYVYEEYRSKTKFPVRVDVPITKEVTASCPTIINHLLETQTDLKTLTILNEIKTIQRNQVLDPSACKCRECPYSQGPIKQQRFLLLERVYQLNCVLSRLESEDDNAV